MMKTFSHLLMVVKKRYFIDQSCETHPVSYIQELKLLPQIWKRWQNGMRHRRTSVRLLNNTEHVNTLSNASTSQAVFRVNTERSLTTCFERNFIVDNLKSFVFRQISRLSCRQTDSCFINNRHCDGAFSDNNICNDKQFSFDRLYHLNCLLQLSCPNWRFSLTHEFWDPLRSSTSCHHSFLTHSFVNLDDVFPSHSWWQHFFTGRCCCECFWSLGFPTHFKEFKYFNLFFQLLH